MESTSVLDFAAPSAVVPGQQLLFRADPAPLPPAAALSLAAYRLSPDWSADAAFRCFLLLLQPHYDQEQAYDSLLDAGCPLEIAGTAWDRWTAQVAGL